MRKLGVRGGKKTITATPRQLESLIRLAEAHARLHLSEVVRAHDVQEAIRLVKVRRALLSWWCCCLRSRWEMVRWRRCCVLVCDPSRWHLLCRWRRSRRRRTLAQARST
jgi:hypothetical protein